MTTYKKQTIGDKVFWFLFSRLFPKYMKELVQLKASYIKSQNSIREKQNELQKIERRIRKLERDKP